MVLTPSSPDIAAVAGVLADASRAAMALAMMDGRAWTAGELGRVAGVARSTATEHADRLVASGLCVEERQGRHRYLRLRDESVADVLERLGTLAPSSANPSGLRAVTRDEGLRAGRTCYRHLAGRLGLEVTHGLMHLDVLTPAFELGSAAPGWFADLGIDATLPEGRPRVRACLDWTERRHHMAGRLADELCATLIEREWLVRRLGTRAVVLTPDGRTELERRGLSLDKERS